MRPTLLRPPLSPPRHRDGEGAGGEVSPQYRAKRGRTPPFAPVSRAVRKRLSLDAPRREALDEELLAVRIERYDRDGHDERPGHQLPVGVDIAEDHRLEADGQRLQLLLRDEDEREQELVERIREGEERDREQR